MKLNVNKKSKYVRGPSVDVKDEDLEGLVKEGLVVQVEERSKLKKTNVNLKKIAESILKSLIGLYIIGSLVGLNEILMMQLNPILIKLHDTVFMSGTLVPWADIALGPIRFMINMLSWFIPILSIIGILIFTLSKMKCISKKELKIFSYALLIILLLVL